MTRHDRETSDIKNLTDIFNLFERHIKHIIDSASIIVKICEQQEKQTTMLLELNGRVLKLEAEKKNEQV